MPKVWHLIALVVTVVATDNMDCPAVRLFRKGIPFGKMDKYTTASKHAMLIDH
jgi:hypothetical protein